MLQTMFHSNLFSIQVSHANTNDTTETEVNSIENNQIGKC